jgi:hypothetical protein
MCVLAIANPHNPRSFRKELDRISQIKRIIKVFPH